MTLKRAFDLFVTIPGLILLAPFMLGIAIAIKLIDTGPVLFRQTRIGRSGKPFTIYKYRTMVPDAERMGDRITIGQDSRITRVGKFLRRYKLDELPQLFNVLKGDMSLVGPRPEVPEYIEYYPEADKNLVLSVRPGITDLASIEFRNENLLLMTADDPVREYTQNILPRKIELYKRYIQERSLWFDILIIMKTVGVLHK
ncbi:MAG TPA: sugar transferase [Chromatiales bacterium]|nr:sugar transferase [Chromatiales bacterium]